MASKGELLEAQAFSRRRLLTAFVSGAPGGRELEPAKPMRAVYIGIALSAAVFLVSLFIGQLDKEMPAGWENGHLVVNTDTGSRYVTKDGTLYPVLNIASARLLLPAGATLDPIKATTSDLEGLAIGKTQGILGAPDTLPTSADLVNAGWMACVVDDAGGVDTRISRTAMATGTDDASAAVLVRADDRLWAVAGDRRYELPAKASDGLLRALGLGEIDQQAVSTLWLSLFEPGTPIAPQSIAGAGKQLTGSPLRVGDVVTGSLGETDRYIVMNNGSLARLTPFAFELYQHSGGYTSDRVRTDVAADEISVLPDASAEMRAKVAAADWPEQAFTSAPASTAPCAISEVEGDRAVTRLGVANSGVELEAGTRVDASVGALVRASGFAAGGASVQVLVDSTGTTYQIPDTSGEDLGKLGFEQGDVGVVGSGWIDLFTGGPMLTVDPEDAADAPAS